MLTLASLRLRRQWSVRVAMRRVAASDAQGALELRQDPAPVRHRHRGADPPADGARLRRDDRRQGRAGPGRRCRSSVGQPRAHRPLRRFGELHASSGMVGSTDEIDAGSSRARLDGAQHSARLRRARGAGRDGDAAGRRRRHRLELDDGGDGLRAGADRAAMRRISWPSASGGGQSRWSPPACACGSTPTSSAATS